MKSRQGSCTAPVVPASWRCSSSRRESSPSLARRACSCTTNRLTAAASGARARAGARASDGAARRDLLPGRLGQRPRDLALRCTCGSRRDRLHRLPTRIDTPPGIRRRDALRPLPGSEKETGVDVAALWRASDLVDEHIGDEPVTPLAPRIAVRAAEHKLPAGLVAALDMHLRAHASGDRLRPRRRRTPAYPRGGGLAAARRPDRADARLAGAPARSLLRALDDRHRRVARADCRALRRRHRGRSTRLSCVPSRSPRIRSRPR